MEVLRGRALNKWRDLVTLFLFHRDKKLALIKEKSIIKKRVPKVVVLWSIIGVIALNLFFYNQSYGKELTRFLSDKPVLSSISSLIYKVSWEKDFEMEELEQEVELSRIKENRAKNKAEEANLAREDAEEKTQQEVKKRAQAESAKKVADQKAQEEESKRKQEELARQVAEQKVLAKEVEEEKMNADKDGDGLSYRQELDQGTLDTDRDSDGDGINDNEDTHPAGGGRYLAQNFQWEYKGTDWTWDYSIHEDSYEYYKNKPRSSHGLEYITSDDPFIQEIAKALKKGAEKENYHLTSFIVSFVQGLPYVADFNTNVADLPKYPIETFIERNGDCEDFSYLSASLIKATGIGVVLVELPNHMAIGIKIKSSAWTQQAGSYYEMWGNRYYYFETTGNDWSLGEMPSEYNNEQAKIIDTWGGETINVYPQYEQPCDVSPNFSGYYTDGDYYYSDSQCRYKQSCLSYEGYYYNPDYQKLYHDSSCSQIVVKGCSKSTSPSGYFIKSGEYYYDSQCSQQARVCRSSTYSYDNYWDGYDFYWNSSCTQKVVSWCSKSTYNPGYFISSIDYEYYYDYQCTQIVPSRW